MEYAQNAAQAQMVGKTTPELGRLKAIAERVGASAARVEGLLERFHGPVAAHTNGQPPSPPSTYRNDIATIFKQLERLESAIIGLDTIG